MLSPFLRIALLLGVCVHLVGFLLFRVTSNPLPTRESSVPFVRYVSPETLLTGPELEEQAALFDSAPLFVPGRWNAAHDLQAPMRDRALLRFPAYEPPTDFSSTLLPEGVPFSGTYPVAEPLDLLDLRYWDLFRGFAAGPRPAAFEASGVFAEVRRLDGTVLRTLPVAIDLLSLQAMRPAIYYLRIESGGRAVGRATLSVGSGDTAFDAAAYSWLTESGFSAGLPAGFFQILIYP
jgi:hypothetical protein